MPKQLDTEIYIIPQTKEWFFEYDDYINRLDYYHRRKFVCEITGNSCLTFFEAYESENKEIKDVERNFPEALREHILRFLQFNRISRLDQLVDKVYLVFKNEYFPGEEVFVKVLTGKPENPETGEGPSVSSRKQRGAIREKVQYANPDDTKYLVSIMTDGSQIIATNNQISRDRNHFTKWLIKTFVKLSVTRSHKVGAPWVVKHKYAKKYRIPHEYPEDLKTFASTTPSGEILYEEDLSKLKSPTPQVTPEAASSKSKKVTKNKSLKKKATLNAAKGMDNIELITVDDIKEPKQLVKDGPRRRFAPYHIPPLVRKELDDHDQPSLSSIQPSKKTMVSDLQLSFDIQNPKPIPSELLLPENAVDLQKEASENLSERLKEIEKEVEDQMDTKDKSPEQLHAEQSVASIKKELASFSTSNLRYVQEALECWAFLNIYHLVFNLDTFTFDDFLCALSWNSKQLEEHGRCELLDEIWCAVLSGFMSNQIPTGKDANRDDSDYSNLYGLQVSLPPKTSLLQPQAKKGEIDNEDDEARGSDSEDGGKTLQSEDDASENDLGSESPKVKTKSQKQNGSTKKTEGDDEVESNAGKEKDEGEESEEEEEPKDHLAHQVKNYRSTKWHDRLRKRNFKDGNWQVILLGVLSMVDYLPAYQDTINAVYRALAPIHIQPANASTVLNQFYSSMGLDLRIKTLHILTALLINGTLVRSYIDDCLDQSTSLRRNRLDVIRDYRDALGMANKAHTTIFEKLFEAYDNNTNPDFWSGFNRKKPRFHTKGYSLNEYEQLLFDSDEEFKNTWEQRDEFIEKIKTLKDELKKVETRLTEIDCQRVRLLGKDRHFNRYWWFENNGLPNLHFSSGMDEEEDGDHTDADEYDDDEKEDVQEETYLMGRLWIQGPSDADVTLNLLLTPEGMRAISQTVTNDKDAVKKEVTEEEQEPPRVEVHDFQDGGAPVKVMDFTKIPSSYKEMATKFGVEFDKSEIKVNGTTCIDRLGALPETQDASDMSPIHRKLIEEAPSPLTDGNDWRYYDDEASIDKLISWLNPWGVRESGLKKELVRVKDALLTSITARRKALWLNGVPKNENDDINTQLEAVENKIEQLKAGVVNDGSEEEDDVIIGTKKRTNRGSSGRPSKLQKTPEETLKTGTIEELGGLHSKLVHDKHNKKIENQVNRVLEWVNSKAKDAFDKTLYEGGDKAKPKPRKARK